MFVVQDLLQEQAKLHVYDPEVTHEEMWQEMKYTCNVTHDNTPMLDESVTNSASPYEACDGAHAICILTEWDELKSLEYEKIFEHMAKPAFLCDGRNILDHAALRGWDWVRGAIWKPDPLHFTDL